MIYRASKRVPCENQPDYLRLVTIDRPTQKNKTFLREAYRFYYHNSDTEYWEEVRWYEKNEDCDNWDCLSDSDSGDLEAIFQQGL